MSIAGHVSKEMLEHYSHIRMEAKRNAVDALDRLKPSSVTTATVTKNAEGDRQNSPNKEKIED